MQHPDNQLTSPRINSLEISERKARLYGTLATLWWLPTLGCTLILVMGIRHWLVAPTLAGVLGRIRIEDWIALAIMTVHPIFGVLYWKNRRSLLRKQKTEDKMQQ